MAEKKDFNTELFDDTSKFLYGLIGKETVMNNHNTYNAGPQGSGDPYDLSLNEAELRLAIPAIQKELIREHICTQENKIYEDCNKEHSVFTRYFSCSENKGDLKTCINKFLDNPDLRQQAVHVYIERRKLFRKFGKHKSPEKNIENTEGNEK